MPSKNESTIHYISGPPADAPIPRPGVKFTKGQTALVITDPQIDFLSPQGVTWGVIGQSVTEHNTVANLERLFKAGKAADVAVFISPHFYYPHDPAEV